jgi:hypothetical protein
MNIADTNTFHQSDSMNQHHRLSCFGESTRKMLLFSNGVTSTVSTSSPIIDVDESFKIERLPSSSQRNMSGSNRSIHVHHNKLEEDDAKMGHDSRKVAKEEEEPQPYRYRRQHQDICVPPLMQSHEHRNEHIRSCIDPVVVAPPSTISTMTLQPPDICPSATDEPQGAPTKKCFTRNMIRVGADTVPMVGSDETIHAHLGGNSIDTVCTQCATLLFCIQSATMVICPTCRCISPTENDTTKKMTPTSDVHLGIGLTLEHVLGLQ